MWKEKIVKFAKQSLEDIQMTVLRFPLPIMLCVILASITIYRIEVPYEKLRNIDEILNRIMAVIVLGVPFSLGVDLLVERFWAKICCHVKIVINSLKLVLLVLYYYFALPNIDMVPMLRLSMLALAMIFIFISALYMFKRENFEIFVTKIMTKVAMTAFFSVMLGLGITFTLFAIQSLLYENMSRDLYAYTWIIINFVFAPTHFLSGFPKIDEECSVKDYSKVLKLLLIYIVMPIISIFTLVLYTYFAKIIVTQIWPKGIVSYLVLSYAGAGIATLFLIKPFVEENKWVRIFTQILTKTILPLLVMMFIAIGIRIGEFGFTESRYYILIIGIWATFAMIFLNFDKGKQNVVLPISLAFVLLVSVVGPLSAFNVSIASQNQRFQNILSKNDMIYNDEIVIKSDIDKYDKREISGILRYFERTHDLEKLEYLPSDFTMRDIKETFGFKEVHEMSIYKRAGSDSGLHFHFGIFGVTQIVDICNYDILIKRSELLTFESEATVEGTKNIQGAFFITRKENYLVVLKDDVQIIKYDIAQTAETLIEKYGIRVMDPDLDKRDLIVQDEDDYVRFKLVFNKIFGSYDEETGEIEIRGAEVLILIDIKE